MASRLLCKVMRNKKPLCLLEVVAVDGRLGMNRYDFESWDYNRREGIVEANYIVDEENTGKLAQLLGATSERGLVAAFGRKFREGNNCHACESNFRRFCEDNQIEFDYRVWY